MDLTRFGIKPKIKRNTSSYYRDVASLKSSSIYIENKALGESINDFIQSNIMVTRSEDKKGIISKVKKGAKNVLDKIIAFFIKVKNFFVKKIKQVKEYFFGKKVESVKKKAEKFDKEIKTMIKTAAKTATKATTVKPSTVKATTIYNTPSVTNNTKTSTVNNDAIIEEEEEPEEPINNKTEESRTSTNPLRKIRRTQPGLPYKQSVGRPMILDQFFEFPEILTAGSLEELKNKYEKTNAGEELLNVLKSFNKEVNGYLNDHRNAANKKDGGSTDRRHEAITKIGDTFKNSFDKFQKSLEILKTIGSRIDQNAKMVKLSFSKDRKKIELTKANIGNTILLIDNVRKIVDMLEKDGIEDLNSTISKLNALKKVAIEQNYDWTSSYGDMYNRATKFVNHLMGNMNQMISLTNSIVTSLDHILIKNTMNLSEVSPDGYMKIDRRTF